MRSFNRMTLERSSISPTGIMLRLGPGRYTKFKMTEKI